MNSRSGTPAWISLVIGIIIGAIMGFVGGCVAENHATHMEHAIVPDTETIINAMIAEVPDNGPMIRSTIQFAAASDTLNATYEPANPDHIKITGTGFSSTEIKYDFVINLRYDKIDTKWEVSYWKWNKT